MKILGFTLLITTVAAATAAAQPGPRPPAPPKPGFAVATSFQACTSSWAFACNMRDAQGRGFGTAHQVQHCEKYTFEPNGTYSMLGDLGVPDHGTYVMIGNTVRITPINADGTKDKPFDLVLSADGNKLGTLTKLKP